MTRAGHLCEDTEVKGERVLCRNWAHFLWIEPGVSEEEQQPWSWGGTEEPGRGGFRSQPVPEDLESQEAAVPFEILDSSYWCFSFCQKEKKQQQQKTPTRDLQAQRSIVRFLAALARELLLRHACVSSWWKCFALSPIHFLFTLQSIFRHLSSVLQNPFALC